MSGSENTTAERAERLEDVIAEYERSAELGQLPDTMEFVDRHPDLASELQEYFDNRASFEQIAAPLRWAVSGPDRIQDFGDYVELEEIGRGGMAVVYKAHHKKLCRPVALKLIRTGPYTKPEDKARFQAEAIALAGLQHSNIVVINDIGEHDGHPYLCLEYMEGGTLAERIANGVPRANRESAELLCMLATAADYSHEKDIVHGDLKPANVLFTAKGDEGVAKIADFGLAKRLDDEPETRNKMVGTVNFMAPEQIDSKLGSIGRATDVWALGVILYQLLTGRTPFQATTPSDTLEQAVNHDPVNPRRLNRKVDRDVETICLKCLKKEPHKRYPSAKNLAEDLQAYLDGKPLPHANVWERTIKWIRRRPALAVLLACSVVLAVTAIGFARQFQVSKQLRIAERRADAVEDAWEAIEMYHLDEADTAILDAKARGASVEQLGPVRSWLAVIRGRPREAITRLQEAGTETVTAVAILATAYNDAGKLGRYEDTLAELEERGPKTSRDYLLLAQAQSYADPFRGLQTATEAIDRHDSVIARLIRAEIAIKFATLYADLSRAGEACEDARDAKRMSRNEPAALSASAIAQLVAARLFKDTGQEQKSADALFQARTDIQALADFPTHPVAALARWLFFDSQGEEYTALTELRQANEHDPKNPWIAQLYALALYRGGEFSKAHGVLEQTEGGGGSIFFDLARAHILAGESSDRLAEARDALDIAEDPDGLFAVFLPATLCLLGDKRGAIEFAQGIEAATVPSWRDGWYHRLLEYNRNELKTEVAETQDNALLRFAGNSMWNQCEAYYFIALNLLAEGDRPGAREHFTKSVDTHVSDYFAYQWSRAFLTRLDNDKSWPSWID